jgi:hypothetical protein
MRLKMKKTFKRNADSVNGCAVASAGPTRKTILAIMTIRQPTTTRKCRPFSIVVLYVGIGWVVDPAVFEGWKE